MNQMHSKFSESSPTTLSAMREDTHTFYFRVFNTQSQKISEGYRKALSEEELYLDLVHEGYGVVRIQPVSKMREILKSLRSSRNSLSEREKILFFFHGGHLLNSNIPLVEVLDILSSNDFEKGGQDVLHVLKTSVKEGLSLSYAMEKFPDIFPVFVRVLVRLAENTGNYGPVFIQLASYLKQQESESNDLKKALRYPVFLGCVMLGAVSILLSILVPEIESYFQSLHQELPWSTQILVRTGNLMYRLDFWACIMGLVGGIVLFWQVLSVQFQGVLYKIPGLGGLLQKQAQVQFLRSLSFLMTHQLDLPQALKIIEDVETRTFFKTALGHLLAKIQEGIPLSTAISDTAYDQSFLMRLVRGGEKSGHLVDSIILARDLEEADFKEKKERFLGLLEPFLTLLLGGVLMWLALALLWPLYENLGNMDVF